MLNAYRKDHSKLSKVTFMGLKGTTKDRANIKKHGVGTIVQLN